MEDLEEEDLEIESTIKVPDNHYFNNNIVQSKIELYLQYPAETRKTDPELSKLRSEIMVEITKIINGIIFKHRFTVWASYDDLLQEASEASIKALEKFNPNYITSKGVRATAFNYFSLTAKRCLKFYTMRDQKHRNNSGLEEHEPYLSYNEVNGYSFAEEFIKHLRNIFTLSGNKKYMPLINVLEEYLQKIGVYNKRDFFRYSKLFGFSPNLIRKFLKIIKDNKEEIYATATEK